MRNEGRSSGLPIDSPNVGQKNQSVSSFYLRYVVSEGQS